VALGTNGHPAAPSATGKELSFDWLAIRSTLDTEGASDDGDDDDEPFVDDPYGINRLAGSYKPARIGPKRVTVDPEGVSADDFVIVRAQPQDDDRTCFTIAGYDVPLWLCKVRFAPGAALLAAAPILTSRIGSLLGKCTEPVAQPCFAGAGRDQERLG
jgi:hypothetical protein